MYVTKINLLFFQNIYNKEFEGRKKNRDNIDSKINEDNSYVKIPKNKKETPTTSNNYPNTKIELTDILKQMKSISEVCLLFLI